MTSQTVLQEFNVFLDSSDRETKNNKTDADTNPTNDIVVPLRMSQRLNCTQVSLASLEMPLTQYTVEKEWQVLDADEGLNLNVLYEEDLDRLRFSVVEEDAKGNVTTHEIQLPARFNFITDVNETKDYFEFTTLFPHSLELREFFNYGERMRIISSRYSPTMLDNYPIQIMSPTVFRALNPPPAGAILLTLGPYRGILLSPTIPSPEYLASFVTYALNLEVPDRWRVTYDRKSGRFRLQYVGLRMFAPKTAYIEIPGRNSLPSLMGFGCTNFQLTHQSTTSGLMLWGESIESYGLVGKITIEDGNYTATSLMSQLKLQLNRFYFDTGATMNFGSDPQYPNSSTVFAWSDKEGETHTCTIPMGAYSVHTLIDYLQSQMVGTVPDLTITYDSTTGKIVFDAPSPFGLEFTACTAAMALEFPACTGDMAARLGFWNISYRGFSHYESPIPFFCPTVVACGTTYHPERFFAYLYDSINYDSISKFYVQITKPRSVAATDLVVDEEAKLVTITTGDSTGSVAHGFQPLDVVDVDTPFGRYSFLVSEVLSYNQFVLQLHGVPTNRVYDPITYPDFVYTFSMSGNIYTNLYFHQNNQYPLARLLGFDQEDYLWDPTHTQWWYSPSSYSMDWPPYLLFEMIEPDGVTRNFHSWEVEEDRYDNRPRILGKIILYPQLRLERILQYHMTFADTKTVNRVKIRILNPDHTLYRLHGKDFSFSLALQAMEKSMNLLCP